MKVREFPDCCAIRLVTSFGNTDTALDSTPYSKKDVEEYLDKLYNAGSKLEIIILNEQQVKKLGLELFTVRGYEVTKRWYYEGHRNELYLLTKHNGAVKPE